MDLDNLLKRFFDALQETVFSEVPGRDGCVVEIRTRKVRVDSEAKAGADLEIQELPVGPDSDI
jgi:Holliday junction resolvase RusA-like endonuclease